MQNLTEATKELFRRGPDECFASLSDLRRHCQQERERSADRWHPPQDIHVRSAQGKLDLMLGEDGAHRLNDWSFSQTCKLAAVSRDTLNKLSADTAAKVLEETLPSGARPLQAFTSENLIRSIHGAAYTRLYNADLVDIVGEFATDFQPPQTAAGGGSGLYCGEQDMFVFLIDPLGWAEIEGQAFAPGFFLWNSEVGRRSVGIQTFWFQAVCENHIVWDAVEVVDFARKHTANVHDCLAEIRRHIDRLTSKRDARRDGFSRVIAKAFKAKLGDSAEDVAKILTGQGIPRNFATQALAMAQETGRFTIFSLVDALTRLAGRCKFAGDRIEADARAASLLAMAQAA